MMFNRGTLFALGRRTLLGMQLSLGLGAEGSMSTSSNEILTGQGAEGFLTILDSPWQ